jgi:hypothetical protein
MQYIVINIFLSYRMNLYRLRYLARGHVFRTNTRGINDSPMHRNACRLLYFVQSTRRILRKLMEYATEHCHMSVRNSSGGTWTFCRKTASLPNGKFGEHSGCPNFKTCFVLHPYRNVPYVVFSCVEVLVFHSSVQ